MQRHLTTNCEEHEPYSFIVRQVFFYWYNFFENFPGSKLSNITEPISRHNTYPRPETTEKEEFGNFCAHFPLNSEEIRVSSTLILNRTTDVFSQIQRHPAQADPWGLMSAKNVASEQDQKNTHNQTSSQVETMMTLLVGAHSAKAPK